MRAFYRDEERADGLDEDDMPQEQIARALGDLEGSFRELKDQNRLQHAENREALEKLAVEVDSLVRAKNVTIGIVAGVSLAGGVLGSKIAALLRLIN